MQLIWWHHIVGSAGHHSLGCAGYCKWLTWLLVCWPWLVVVKRLIGRRWNFFYGVSLPKRQLWFEYFASHWFKVVGQRTESTFLISHFVSFPGNRLNRWVLYRVGLLSVHVSFVDTAFISVEPILNLSFFLYLPYQIQPLFFHDPLLVTLTVVIVCETREKARLLDKFRCWVRSADKVDGRQHWLSFRVKVRWMHDLVANLSLLSFMLAHFLLQNLSVPNLSQLLMLVGHLNTVLVQYVLTSSVVIATVFNSMLQSISEFV